MIVDSMTNMLEQDEGKNSVENHTIEKMLSSIV